MEDRMLAPYAARSARVAWPQIPGTSHEHRAEFQRDRDRVITASCFRRLEYKTQVFINGTADHYRTRLTHTIEMTAVGPHPRPRPARQRGPHRKPSPWPTTSATALRPRRRGALNELMRNHGGFDHNIQSVRWVEDLEAATPASPAST
jgi:dGTPase